MVEGWVRGWQGLGYGWVVVRVGWVYRVGQEGRDWGRVGERVGWGTGGLAYGVGVGHEGTDRAVTPACKCGILNPL